MWWPDEELDLPDTVVRLQEDERVRFPALEPSEQPAGRGWSPWELVGTIVASSLGLTVAVLVGVAIAVGAWPA